MIIENMLLLNSIQNDINLTLCCDLLLGWRRTRRLLHEVNPRYQRNVSMCPV